LTSKLEKKIIALWVIGAVPIFVGFWVIFNAREDFFIGGAYVIFTAVVLMALTVLMKFEKV